MRPGQMYQDGTLPHQIRIVCGRDGALAVSCNCMGTGQCYEPLEVRWQWEPGEAQAAWRAHLAGPQEVAS